MVLDRVIPAYLRRKVEVNSLNNLGHSLKFSLSSREISFYFLRQNGYLGRYDSLLLLLP